MEVVLTNRISLLRSRLDQAKGHREAVEKRVASLEGEIKELEAEEELLDLVSTLFRSLIDKEVTEGVQAVERLQTEGLQAVFNDMDLTVRADVDIQRGAVSVELVTIQTQPDGTVTEGPSTDAFGGSVATVQSVLMRIIVVLRRDMRPLLLLDESLAAVAEHYVPAVGQFLSKLCGRLDMDVLAVTHNQVLVESANKAYRIQKKGGAATFKELR